jgi:C-terminal processing protease CtpA/Prc
MGNSNNKHKFKCSMIQLPSKCNDWGFVFSINMKPKYMIYSVDAESSAYSANLRVNDVIVQIDGHYVRNMKHDKVKRMLDDSLKVGYVEILTIDLEGYKWFKLRRKLLNIESIITRKNIEFFSTPISFLKHKTSKRSSTKKRNAPVITSSDFIDPAKPRLCRLTRSDRNESYGFDFVTIKSENRHIANNVKQDLPAHKFGLRDNDYILEINGHSVENLLHENMIELILHNPFQVELLVVKDYDAYVFNRI